MIMMEYFLDNVFDCWGENNFFFKILSGNLIVDNVFIKRYWEMFYKWIGYCNCFLVGIQNSLELEKKIWMIVEVCFLCVIQYFYFVSYFKNVFLVENVLMGEEVNNVIKILQVDILKWCVIEFIVVVVDLFCFFVILVGEVGCVCKQVVFVFFGCICMLQKDWKSGVKVFYDIMELGDNVINVNYQELFYFFIGILNKENIFYIQYLENYLGIGLLQYVFFVKDGGWSLVNLVVDLYELYEFKDGIFFSYDDLRYDLFNLGKDCDLCLDYIIYYNGVIFMGIEYKMSFDYSVVKKEKFDYMSEVFRIGFMMRKYFEELIFINDVQSVNGLILVICYVEVLLGYLECLVEDN